MLCCPALSAEHLALPPSIKFPRCLQRAKTRANGERGGTHPQVCTRTVRAPDHLWGLPCQQRARQASLTYCQGQGRLLHFNNALDLGQAVATSPCRVPRNWGQGPCSGKSREQFPPVPKDLGSRERNPPALSGSPHPGLGLVPDSVWLNSREGENLGGGQGPECSPCVDQFGQTVPAGVALGPGAGLPEHLLLPSCPDGSNPQCLQQGVLWEPQQRGRCPDGAWEGQTFHPNSPLHRAVKSLQWNHDPPNEQRKPLWWVEACRRQGRS